jgi:hypothetical protein
MTRSEWPWHIIITIAVCALVCLTVQGHINSRMAAVEADQHCIKWAITHEGEHDCLKMWPG